MEIFYDVIEDERESVDFMDLRMGIVSYNSDIDLDIYKVAKFILMEDGTSLTKISEKLNLASNYVELIQGFFSKVEYRREVPLNGGKYDSWVDYNARPFNYGTSPRGLFCGDREYADLFIREFEWHLKNEWGIDTTIKI